MRQRILKGIFWLLLFSLLPAVSQGFQDPFDISWNTSTKKVAVGESFRLDVYFFIPREHFLYKDKITLSLLDDQGYALKELNYSPSIRKHDVFRGKELEVYEEQARLSADIVVSSQAALSKGKARFVVTYQGCSPKLCFRQQTKEIAVPLTIVSQAGSVSETSMPGGSSGLVRYLQDSLQARGWLAFLIAFIGGILTDFTPCVLPLIPLTLAVVGVRKETRHWHNFLHTGVLVLAMALSYALMGVAASMLGLQLGFLYQNTWFLLLGAGLFFVFALGMFGAYEMQVPLWLRNRMARIGGQTYGGAALAGVTLGILAAPCVGPIFAALLVWVAQTRDLVQGFGLMFAFGLGMGSLILAVGTYYGSLAGKIHGGVLSLWVKRGLGVLLLVPAFYYGWVAYAHWTPRINGEPAEKAASELWVTDFKVAQSRAQKEQKPLLIDFYADWCLPCIEWDKRTFSRAKIRETLANEFVSLKVDCTQNTPMCKEMVERYEVIGWPTIIVTDSTGREIAGKRIVGEIYGPEKFLEFLDRDKESH